MLNCKVGTLPISYLGLALGASSKDLAVWIPVIKRVEKQLVDCKKVLVKRGEGSVDQNTLPKLLHISCQAPGKVNERLKHLQRNFL